MPRLSQRFKCGKDVIELARAVQTLSECLLSTQSGRRLL